MRKLLVKDLHPGMVTAEDIFSIDGQLILPQNGIEKLEAFAIYSVRIEDEEVAPPQTSFFDTPSYSERIKSNPDFINFKKSFEDHVESLQTGLNQIVESNSGFDAEKLLSQTVFSRFKCEACRSQKLFKGGCGKSAFPDTCPDRRRAGILHQYDGYAAEHAGL